jgi:hypothetical protein
MDDSSGRERGNQLRIVHRSKMQEIADARYPDAPQRRLL